MFVAHCILDLSVYNVKLSIEVNVFERTNTLTGTGSVSWSEASDLLTRQMRCARLRDKSWNSNACYIRRFSSSPVSSQCLIHAPHIQSCIIKMSLKPNSMCSWPLPHVMVSRPRFRNTRAHVDVTPCSRNVTLYERPGCKSLAPSISVMGGRPCLRS